MASICENFREAAGGCLPCRFIPGAGPARGGFSLLFREKVGTIPSYALRDTDWAGQGPRGKGCDGMKLLVIDGNSIVNRAFFGMHPLNNKEGFPTHAIFGFLNILRRMERELEPDGICVTFDR